MSIYDDVLRELVAAIGVRVLFVGNLVELVRGGSVRRSRQRGGDTLPEAPIAGRCPPSSSDSSSWSPVSPRWRPSSLPLRIDESTAGETPLATRRLRRAAATPSRSCSSASPGSCWRSATRASSRSSSSTTTPTSSSASRCWASACGGVIVVISRRLPGCDRHDPAVGPPARRRQRRRRLRDRRPVRIDTLAIWDYGSLSSFCNLARLLGICLALFASFIAVGVMIATLFAGRPTTSAACTSPTSSARASRAWSSSRSSLDRPSGDDLPGGAGSRPRRSPPRRSWAPRLVPVGVVLRGRARPCGGPSVLPSTACDEFKGNSTSRRPVYSSWSPIFRRRRRRHRADLRILYHDGLVGSVIYRWDGDRRPSPASIDDPRAAVRGGQGRQPERADHRRRRRPRDPDVALLRRRHIGAVELNPVTYRSSPTSSRTTPGISPRTRRSTSSKGDGRSYLARSDDTYNLVWYPRRTATRRPTRRPPARSCCRRATCTRARRSRTASSTSAERNPRRAVRRVRLRRQAEPDVPVRGDGAARARGARGPTTRRSHILVATSPVEGAHRSPPSS